jgi:hypothetical protein
MAYALAQVTGRPDLGVNAAQKAVSIVTEASLGQKNMEVACAYAVLGAALHATGDVGAALREYRSVNQKFLLYCFGLSLVLVFHKLQEDVTFASPCSFLDL